MSTKTMPVETRQKISKSLKGRRLTRKHKKHISQGLRGVYRFEPAGRLVGALT